MPQELLSDQGRNIESKLFQDVCNVLGIHKTRTTPYHPQLDGMAKWFNGTLENGLSMFVNHNHTNWDKHVPLIPMANRSAIHKKAPAQMMFGCLKLQVNLWQERICDEEQMMEEINMQKYFKTVLVRCITLLL